MRELFCHSLLKYCISIVVGLLLVLSNLLFKLIETPNPFTILLYYVDGFFIAGMVFVCVGGLSTVSFYGAFDIFTYMFSKKSDMNGRIMLSDYSDRKRKKKEAKGRYGYVPYYVVGVSFIIVSLILYIFI